MSPGGVRRRSSFARPCAFTSVFRSIGLLLVWPLLLVACGDDDAPERGQDDFACPSPMAACDVREPQCRRAVLDVTTCIWGSDEAFELPETRVITRDEFRQELGMRVAQMEPREDDSPWERALELLHLLRAGSEVMNVSLDETVTAVAAFYDEGTQAVTLIADEPEADPLEQVYVLSHELTHYLQDQRYGLGALRRAAGQTTDNTVAFVSLVEGDAVVTSTRVIARIQGRSADELPWDRYFDSMLDTMLSSIRASAAPLITALQTLPYPVGGRYFAQAWLRYGRSHVDALYEGEAPAQLVDWLAGYGPGRPRASLRVPLRCAPPLPPSELTLHGLDSFGAAGVIALLASLDPDAASEEVLTLAGALRDDLVVVYTPEPTDDDAEALVLAAWRLRFASEAHAQDVETRLELAFGAGEPRQQENGPARGVLRDAAEVLLYASDQAMQRFTDGELEACPSFSDLVEAGAAADATQASRRLAPFLPRLLPSRVGMARAGGFEPP